MRASNGRLQCRTMRNVASCVFANAMNSVICALLVSCYASLSLCRNHGSTSTVLMRAKVVCVAAAAASAAVCGRRDSASGTVASLLGWYTISMLVSASFSTHQHCRLFRSLCKYVLEWLMICEHLAACTFNIRSPPSTSFNNGVQFAIMCRVLLLCISE